MRRASAVAWWLVVLAFLAVALAPFMFAQPSKPSQTSTAVLQVTPLSPALSKACWPSAMLKGKDTAWLYVPCRSLDVLPIGFREPLECTLAESKRVGDDPLVQETMRSQALQSIYWRKGRLAPGPIVTRVSDVRRGFHGYGLAADIISAKYGWRSSRFFVRLGHAAEKCGLVAGVFWPRLQDGPHVQYAGWVGAPPLWARDLLSFGADSLAVIHRRAGVAN